MSAGAYPGFIASGNIQPARIVVGATTPAVGNADVAFTVKTAPDATTMPVGISAEYTRYAPGTAWDNGYIAQDGQDLKVYQDGELCTVEIGADIVAMSLISADQDGSGRAVPCTGTNYYAAQALNPGWFVSGTRIRARVVRGQI
jgi:hypothetical protein